MGDHNCRGADVDDRPQRSSADGRAVIAHGTFGHLFLPCQDPAAFGVSRDYARRHIVAGMVYVTVNDFDGVVVEVENGGAVVSCRPVMDSGFAVAAASGFQGCTEEGVDSIA